MNGMLTLKKAKNIIQRQLERSFGLPEYTSIMSSVQPGEESFQRRFNAFYKVRRNKEWRVAYYAVFTDKLGGMNVSFKDIIEALQERTGRCEASFASKMLATLNKDKPILDSNVLSFLGLRLSDNIDIKERVKEAIRVYESIEAWYRGFLASDEGKNCVALFDKTFPKYKDLSPVKKIDCFLWGSVGDGQSR